MVTPTTSGAASGLRITPWITAPAIASEPPASHAIRIRGSSKSRTVRTSSTVPWPNSAFVAVGCGTLTAPMPSVANETSSASPKMTPMTTYGFRRVATRPTGWATASTAAIYDATFSRRAR